MNAPPTTAFVHVGTPPPDFNGWTTTKIYFRGFADLSAVRNVPVYTPEFIAVGNPWCLCLYPGGVVSSNTGGVAIYLVNQSNESIGMNVGFSIKDGNGNQIAKRQSSTPTFGPVGSHSNSGAWPNVAERSKLLNALVDGTLVVEVHMKSPTPIKAALPHFIPENPSACKIIPLMFNDKESSDIVFKVGEHQSKNNAEEMTNIAPMTFYAHLIIIKACSTILADMCESKGDPITPWLRVSTLFELFQKV